MQDIKMNGFRAGALSLAVSVGLAGPVLSETEQGTAGEPQLRTMESITVTAEKRESDLEKTPIAITAVSEKELENSGIEDIEDLQFAVPSLTFGVIQADTQITLRGVGNENITPGGDPGVALHVDGVYLGRPSAAFTDFLDLERIEVLRGPQGTLYGRNATGGSVNLITKKPTNELLGKVDLLAGDYDRFELSAAVGGPLGEKLFARVSAFRNERDGYHDNLLDGSTLDDADAWATRAELDIRPTDSTSVLLSGFTHREEGTGSVAKNIADGIPDLRSSMRDTPQSQDNDYGGFTATVTAATDRLLFTSISSYQELFTDVRYDGDGTAFPLDVVSTQLDAEQFSQELRLQSVSGGDSDWMVGLYYLDESLASDFEDALAFFGILQIDATVDTQSLGLFGQLSRHLTDRVALTVGARYTDDDKEALDHQLLAPVLDLTIPQANDWQEVTGNIGVDIELSDESFLYAKVSRGYKSGGFNLPGDGLPYDPETVLSYEVGSKNRLAGGKALLNATAFLYDYEDMQVFQVRNFQTLIENAAESTIAGLEVELQARPAAGTLVQGSVSYLDAEYDVFQSIDPRSLALAAQDLSGNKLNRTPELSAHLGLQHSFELGDGGGVLTPRIDASWQDEVFYSQFNRPEERQGSFSRTDVHLLWDSRGGRFTAAVFAKNLEDEDVIGNVLTTQLGQSVVLYAPRTFGGRFGIRF